MSTCQCGLYLFSKFQPTNQVKLQLITINNNNSLNDTLKRRFFKFCNRSILLFKKANQHFDLFQCVIFVIGTSEFFQFRLKLIYLCCKLCSLFKIFCIIQKSLCFQAGKDVGLLPELCDFFMNFHNIGISVKSAQF